MKRITLMLSWSFVMFSLAAVASAKGTESATAKVAEGVWFYAFTVLGAGLAIGLGALGTGTREGNHLRQGRGSHGPSA